MNLVLICHRCDSCAALPKNGGCSGKCPCLADPQRRDIIELTQIGHCPLDKFSWQARWLSKLREIFARKTEARKPKLAHHLIYEGPALWAELHRWAMYGEIGRPLLWLEKFAERLGAASIGCQCASDWKAWMLANPVNIESRDALFAWTVAAHNAVNTRLGKPQMTVEAARARWS